MEDSRFWYATFSNLLKMDIKQKKLPFNISNKSEQVELLNKLIKMQIL